MIRRTRTGAKICNSFAFQTKVEVLLLDKKYKFIDELNCNYYILNNLNSVKFYSSIKKRSILIWASVILHYLRKCNFHTYLFKDRSHVNNATFFTSDKKGIK